MIQTISEFLELNNGVIIRENKIVIQNEIEEVENKLKLSTIPESTKLYYENKLRLLKDEFEWAKKVEVNPSIVKFKFTSDKFGKRLLKD